MRYKKNFIIIASVLMLIHVNHLFAENTKVQKKMRINWEKVQGAVKYNVQVVNKNSVIIFEKIVETNYIYLSIPPGNYKIRIGAIDRFDRIGSWSDWSDVKVAKFTIDNNIYLYGLGFKIALGMSYYMLMPQWNTVYKNSFLNASLNIAYDFWNIKFLRAQWFSRYTGLEFEADYLYLESKKSRIRIGSNMHNILTGANFYIKSNFNLPLNIILRGGSGLTFSRQKYNRYDYRGNIIGTGIVKSRDFFLKAGLSIEYNFLPSYFIECGVDYLNIFYMSEHLKGLRYNCMIGVKI